jgi:hypothetical protein
MDHSDGCDEYANCYSNGYSDGCYDEDSDASGSAPTGCRTRVDLSSPLHYTLALRVCADSSVQVQIMAYPTILYADMADDEDIDCRYCAVPVGTRAETNRHQDRCLTLLAKLHRMKFDPRRQAGGRRRRGKDAKAAAANRPEGDSWNTGTINKSETPTVVYPLGTLCNQPRMPDPKTTHRTAQPSSSDPLPPPSPACRLARSDSSAAGASSRKVMRSTASYFSNPPSKPMIRSQSSGVVSGKTRKKIPPLVGVVDGPNQLADVVQGYL